MAHLNKEKFKYVDNTGFGANSSIEGSRLTNKDGSINLQKRGLPFWDRISIYHTLLKMSRWMLLTYILLFYTLMNFFFATVYFFIGPQHLVGASIDGGAFGQFMNAFFFSSQTLTTVGYGHVAPDGMLMNSVASIESLVGIISFAVVTGLIYGRFSRPRAYILFSDNALISPYKDGRGLMMRFATYKNNFLTDVEVIVTLAMHIQENDKTVTRFFTLPLEFSKINSLSLSWTVVHPINEDSPLYDLTEQDFKDTRMEIIFAVKGFDDHFSNIVQQRTSYLNSEIVYGARFVTSFERAYDGSKTILKLNKISTYEQAALPKPKSYAVNADNVIVNQ